MAAGKGKFGHVYMSLHKPSKRHCAVKYIAMQFMYETQSLARIQQVMYLSFGRNFGA
jgi:serine/threonine protein kinase